MIRPFDSTGVARDAAGVARYQALSRSLIEMLRATVDRTPNAEAIVEVGGPRASYRQLWDRSARVAGGLRARGIGRGDRVACRLENGLDWCLAFFGAQMAGAVIVPVNTRFSAPEVEYVVEDSGSRFSFVPGASLPDGDPFVVRDLGPDDLAAIFYTSGTTGFPKGAMTTQEAFLTNAETCVRVAPLPRDGSVRTLVSVPLFHVTGCNSQLLPTCQSGGTTVIMPAFAVQPFLHAIGEERINVLKSVPAIYWLAMNQPNFRAFDTTGVRWLSYGGAPISSSLVEMIFETFPNARIGNGFGLTETASVATFLPHEYSRSRPETVGFASPVVDLDVFEADPETGVGELLVRGPNVIKSYWNKPRETAAAIVDGWLRTGDLSRIDRDGFVEIVDRKKDMINRGGENVYCVEVESAIASHPAVFEVAVVGVADRMMGEKVGAVIVVRPGMRLQSSEVVSFLRGRIADFKIPQYVSFRAQPLLRNAGGKAIKRPLREETDWGVPVR
jgi:long-chain acyl-CoA synthetase